jgi:hypothetical protein
MWWLLALVGMSLAGCSAADLCETCETDRDCKDDLYCAEFEDGSWRCVDSIWTTCETKSFITAP